MHLKEAILRKTADPQRLVPYIKPHDFKGHRYFVKNWTGWDDLGVDPNTIESPEQAEELHKRWQTWKATGKDPGAKAVDPRPTVPEGSPAMDRQTPANKGRNIQDFVARYNAQKASKNPPSTQRFSWQNGKRVENPAWKATQTSGPASAPTGGQPIFPAGGTRKPSFHEMTRTGPWSGDARRIAERFRNGRGSNVRGIDTIGVSGMDPRSMERVQERANKRTSVGSDASSVAGPLGKTFKNMGKSITGFLSGRR